MKPLSDPEILELNELCSGLLDGTLTDGGRRRLSEWLAASEEARRHYIRNLGLNASLCHYAGEMQLEESEAPAPSRFRDPAWWWIGGLAAAACLALALWLRPVTPAADELPAAAGAEDVARLTGSNACVWNDQAAGPKLGDHLRRGQRLNLQSGFAEVTFDSGAQVVLHGPASLDVNSPWDGTLRQGALRAYVPPQAVGFRITNPSVEVLDLGTEFSLVADANGSAELLVLKGEVEAAPHASTDQDSILLRASEARKFARSGVTSLAQGDQAFASVTHPVAFDRLIPAMHYVHWTLDRADGLAVPAETVGLPTGIATLELSGADSGFAPIANLSEGHRGLRLNGRLFGRAHVPGLSGNVPHTLAFWVRVPADAPLNDSYAMVAWGTGRKLAGHPVQISWNRTPTEGSVGALRTDFGGGSALGTTSLRDGRWHHIAVVFAPAPADRAAPVHVHQYVDGKLESSTTNPPRRAVSLGLAKTETPMEMKDFLYVGCRVGLSGIKSERFRGELDELFVANWGLEPNEIVSVMRDNRLARPGDTSLALR